MFFMFINKILSNFILVKLIADEYLFFIISNAWYFDVNIVLYFEIRTYVLSNTKLEKISPRI